ncbi:MAG: glycosyltransferase [Rikenellaceae bacterium]
MKISKLSVVGPAHPFRGGLASIMEILSRTFIKRGAEVDIKTFTTQYPKFLFPGKSQLLDTPAPKDLKIKRELSTVNPFSWLRVGLRLKREKPDVVLLKYWTPFMAPAFGTVARLARRNGHTKVLVQLDNVIPHEHSFTDSLFNRYFIPSCDGFIYMSDQVKQDLSLFNKKRPALFSPHPLFENFGKSVTKAEACAKLGLDEEIDYSLFFGIIRDYKGLDLLVEAWEKLKEAGETVNKKLIVAGEFYYNKDKYLEQIKHANLADDIVLHDYFIADDMVRYFFCASDVLIQPYRSATQSGVTQIAYHFNLPMIVTRVGGLAEIVPDNVVGYLTDTTPESIMQAFKRFYDNSDGVRFRENMNTEKLRFSWEAMADKLEQLYSLTLSK